METRKDHPALRPKGRHNQKLESNFQPPDWINPAPAERYTLVVIGGGTAGLVSAAICAELGGKAAVVEKDLLGGDCLNVGCVPSKALLRSSRAAADVRGAGRFGVKVPVGVKVDFEAVMDRMRRLRASISPHDSAERFSDLGVDVFLGEGKFNGRNTVRVGGATLRFKKAAITTGARAAAPPIPGLKEAGFLTNESVFTLTRLPERLVVVGAGPIGCELSQAFARFGSQVSVIEKAEHILVREDADAADRVQQSMAKDGVSFHFGSELKEVKTRNDGKVCVLEGEDIVVDEILVSVGRAPNVKGLGLEEAGVAFDERSGVEVNARLRTTNPDIYAAGDVCFPYKFTHTADAMARLLIRNALFPGSGSTDHFVIPWCTYTDPEIAHTGLYEKEAKEKGYDVGTIEVPLKDVDRAVLDGEEEGFLKVHHVRKSGTILGATLVARHAGEMISELTLAINAGLTLEHLSDTIHPYPTQAEALRKSGDFFKRNRLTGWKRALANWWLRPWP